jgi:hypothetical protein
MRLTSAQATPTEISSSNKSAAKGLPDSSYQEIQDESASPGLTLLEKKLSDIRQLQAALNDYIRWDEYGTQEVLASQKYNRSDFTRLAWHHSVLNPVFTDEGTKRARNYTPPAMSDGEGNFYPLGSSLVDAIGYRQNRQEKRRIAEQTSTDHDDTYSALSASKWHYNPRLVTWARLPVRNSKPLSNSPKVTFYLRSQESISFTSFPNRGLLSRGMSPHVRTNIGDQYPTDIVVDSSHANPSNQTAARVEVNVSSDLSVISRSVEGTATTMEDSILVGVSDSRIDGSASHQHDILISASSASELFALSFQSDAVIHDKRQTTGVLNSSLLNGDATSRIVVDVEDSLRLRLDTEKTGIAVVESVVQGINSTSLLDQSGNDTVEIKSSSTVSFQELRNSLLTQLTFNLANQGIERSNISLGQGNNIIKVEAGMFTFISLQSAQDESAAIITTPEVTLNDPVQHASSPQQLNALIDVQAVGVNASLIDAGGGNDQLSIISELTISVLDNLIDLQSDPRIDIRLKAIGLLNSIVRLGEGDDRLSVIGDIADSHVDLGPGNDIAFFQGAIHESTISGGGGVDLIFISQPTPFSDLINSSADSLVFSDVDFIYLVDDSLFDLVSRQGSSDLTPFLSAQFDSQVSNGQLYGNYLYSLVPPRIIPPTSTDLSPISLNLPALSNAAIQFPQIGNTLIERLDDVNIDAHLLQDSY